MVGYSKGKKEKAVVTAKEALSLVFYKKKIIINK